MQAMTVAEVKDEYKAYKNDKLNEKIYLDYNQAMAVVKVASSQFDTAIEQCMSLYKKIIYELQEDWERGLQLIQRHTPDLSYAEIRETMDQVNCTKQTMVEKD